MRWYEFGWSKRLIVCDVDSPLAVFLGVVGFGIAPIRAKILIGKLARIVWFVEIISQ